MREEGHTVGLHCDEHVRHSERDVAWLQRTPGRRSSAGDAGRATNPVADAVGRYGAVDGAVAREHELRLIGWTADTHDWRGDRAEQMFGRPARQLVDGAVVLAHDGIGPGARRDGAARRSVTSSWRRARPRRAGCTGGAAMNRPAGPGLNAAVTRQALARIARRAADRDRRSIPTFPDDAIARPQDAGALAFNAVAGRVTPAGDRGARAGPRRRPRRRVGRADLRRPPQRGRAARRAGAAGAARRRARRGARRAAARRGLGRRPAPGRGTPATVGATRRRRGADGRQDLLLGSGGP